MERGEPERERKDPERADPITRLIANRVREIRDQRLSGAALSAAVRELGLKGWVDSTVGKLETRRRESVTVRELLALAVALDVPPVWLLADPKAGTPVPIADGVEVDPWTALLWLTGSQPLREPGGDAWANAYQPLRRLQILARVLEQYRSIRLALDRPMVPIGDDLVAEAGVLTVSGDLDAARRGLEAAEEAQLRAVADCLGQFAALQLPVPQLPPDMRKRAVELCVELPGQEETTA